MGIKLSEAEEELRKRRGTPMLGLNDGPEAILPLSRGRLGVGTTAVPQITPVQDNRKRLAQDVAALLQPELKRHIDESVRSAMVGLANGFRQIVREELKADREANQAREAQSEVRPLRR